MFEAMKEKIAKAIDNGNLTMWAIIALIIIFLIVAIWKIFQGGDLPEFEANPRPVIWMPGKMP